MNKPDIATAGSALRRRLIDDMTLRRFGEKTQHDYIRTFPTSSGDHWRVLLPRIFVGFSWSSARRGCLRRR
jgi:hypothetical protein